MMAKYKPAQVKKAITAVVTFVVTTASVALEGHLFPETWTPYVVGVETLAGAYGVFRLRNESRRAVAYGPESDSL